MTTRSPTVATLLHHFEDEVLMFRLRRAVAADPRTVTAQLATTSVRDPLLRAAMAPRLGQVIAASHADAQTLEEWVRIGEMAACRSAPASELVSLAATFRATLTRIAADEFSREPDRLAATLLVVDARLEALLLAAVRAHEDAADEFPVATLIHEISNPMTSILLSLQMIAKHATSEATPRIDLLIQEVQRLRRLLLEARDASSSQMTAIADHDLGVIVQQVVTSEQPTAHAHGVSLHIREAMGHHVVQCDRDRIHQVVVNLLRNAIEAATSRVCVEVSSSTSGGAIVVRDDGPGFSAEVLASLGQPFVTTKPTGTGLGLTIARKLVGLHGGQLDVRNDHGAEVTAAFRRYLA